MKGLFLIISCFMLMLLSPLERVDMDAPVRMAENSLMGIEAEENTDVLYNDDTVTLLTTFSSLSDDVIPCRLNRLGRQLRVMSSRIQIRCNTLISVVKRLALLLSVHLTTLLNHISQFYSSIKPFCWQYAVDCYVFAFRQIII